MILPRAEGFSVAALADLYIMEALTNFTPINLPRVMLEHIIKICEVKDASHGLGYGFLLTKVFDHFGIQSATRIASTKK